MLTDYYQTTYAFTSGLGTGNNQIQITGNSGFGAGNAGSTWRIGASGSTLVWGASGEGTATGFFNPTSLKFLTSADNMGTTIYGQPTLDNALDLNGGARTISVAQASGTNALANSRATIARNITGTGGGSLTKTGGGNLVISGTNDYSGGTTISGGMIRFDTRTSMPASGTVSIADGAILGVAVASSGTTWGAGTGVAGIAGIASTANSGGGYGGQSGAVVNFAGNPSLLLNVTANTTESNVIGNGGATNLSLTKTGANTLALTGNNSYSGRTWVHTGTLSFNSIANVGGGNTALGAPSSAANGTISIGSDLNTVTLAYTGSGHSSDRVINLAAASGTATLDASGTGPLTLTSSLTAAAGAKTLTLTGSNTAANTLGASSIPGLAEVLTITKSGAGNWRINGFSSPKNAWSVTAGTLLVAGGITTGDQQVTVSGGTLAGVGPITLQSGKILTVQAAGSLSPGISGAGTLAVTGILNISAMAGGTGKLNFEMSAPASSDKIAVTGTAQIGTGLLGLNDFVFTDLGGMTASTYVLISTTGGITGTLDPANRLGSIGSISGALQINGNNLEFTVDSDLDGIPDSYELANTTPPSATAFNPADDLDTDGSTNLQEYLAGTNPNNSDSDADGFPDGVETNTGTWVSASNTGTNPLVFDTDGDALRDGYETNTGVFASATATGTNPNKKDSDSDGLKDNVETGTGTVVSRTNTGTNPNLSDTDNDGAGDWYEVTASFTSPFLASEKPNIPYPLPDPDASTGATNKPVKVYIMSGQSNVVGIGYVSQQAGGSVNGTLDTITKTEGKFPDLVNASNAYTTRNDVRYRGVVTAIGNAPLTAGQGASTIQLGPELGFGHVMGYKHDEPVILIKASQGNRGLFWDILPPGSPSFTDSGTVYAGYGQSPNSWAVGSGPSPFIWYAGKQYDDFFKAEIDMGVSAWAAGVNYQASGALGTQVLNNGVHYICKLAHTSGSISEPGVGSLSSTYWSLYSIENVSDVLDNFATQYPQYAAQGFEIAGYVWFQGNWDIGSTLAASRYQTSLVRFIKETRSYFASRYPGKASTTTPFVLSTGCGDPGTSGNGLTVANAQLAMNNTTTYPEFTGNVKTIDNRSYWRELAESPGTQGYHYNNNAETYMLTGDALGRAMIDLQASAGGNTFADWMTSFGVAPGLAGFNQDADGDGIKNGVENFFGTNPSVGSSGMVAGASSGNTFVFTHPQNATPATGVTAAYRWSKDLATFRGHGETDGTGTTVNFNAVTNAGITTVTATVTGTATAKLFVDVKVTQN